MRKTTFVRTLSCRIRLFCLISLGMICLPAFAQDATPAAVPAATPAAAAAKEAPAAALPSDPKELMLLAAKTNGLTGDDVKPWHLKATYKLLDEKGATTDQGSYEEFWVSEKKYKRALTGATFTLTEYGTEKGILVSGDQNLHFAQMYELHKEFINPLPSLQSVEPNNFVLQQNEVQGVKLVCLSNKDANGNPFGAIWCLDADKPILRINAPNGGMRTGHNGLVSLQGRSIASDLQFARLGKTVQTAHLDSVESLTAIDEAVFLPPADATPKRIDMRIVNVAGGVMAGMLLRRVTPIYPIEAKTYWIQGTVVLQATIGTDGHIHNLRVVSGPDLLQDSALYAVRQWVYRPYLLNGEPVEVQTTVNIIFTLGG